MSIWLKRFILWDKLSEFLLKKPILPASIAITFLAMSFAAVVGLIIYVGTKDSGDPSTMVLVISGYCLRLLILLGAIFSFIICMQLPLWMYNLKSKITKAYHLMKKDYNTIIENNKDE